MRLVRVRRALLFLACLTALTAAAPPDVVRGRGQGRGRLYQATVRDEKSGAESEGFIDKAGKLIIDLGRLPVDVYAVGEFQEGRAAFYVEEKSATKPEPYKDYIGGYVDETGRVVVEPRYTLVSDFSEGLAYVTTEEFGAFIDPGGKVVFRTHNRMESFHEGLAAAAAVPPGFAGKWGYVDRSGRVVIDKRFEFADDFSEGLAGVVLGDKYGFINRRGEMVIPPRFDLRREGRHVQNLVSAGRFREGLARVSVGGLHGYIDKAGEFVIPPQFRNAHNFSEGLAWATSRDGRTRGWIDKSGRWVITGVRGEGFSFDFSKLSYSYDLQEWKFSEGLAPFLIYEGQRVLWGYLDRGGRVLIEPRELDEADPFIGGLARVTFHEKSDYKPRKGLWYVNNDGQLIREKYGYIDRAGRFVWRVK